MKKISGKDARQGGKGITVFKVLIISIGLALIAWFCIEIYGSRLSNNDQTFMND